MSVLAWPLWGVWLFWDRLLLCSPTYSWTCCSSGCLRLTEITYFCVFTAGIQVWTIIPGRVHSLSTTRITWTQAAPWTLLTRVAPKRLRGHCPMMKAGWGVVLSRTQQHGALSHYSVCSLKLRTWHKGKRDWSRRVDSQVRTVWTSTLSAWGGPACVTVSSGTAKTTKGDPVSKTEGKPTKQKQIKYINQIPRAIHSSGSNFLCPHVSSSWTGPHFVLESLIPV